MTAISGPRPFGGGSTHPNGTPLRPFSNGQRLPESGLSIPTGLRARPTSSRPSTAMATRAASPSLGHPASASGPAAEPKPDEKWSLSAPYKPNGTVEPRQGDTHNHGTLVGTNQRTHALQQHEINQAGYFTGRASLGEAIEGADNFERLRNGNESHHETRAHLVFGRGNMRADLQTSGGIGGQCVQAARMVGSENPDLTVAAAFALGAGNCGEYATITSRFHGPRLRGEETIHTVYQPGFDHGFNQIRTPGKPIVTLDAWSNGPAMQAQDTVWHTSGRQTLPHETFDSHTGPAAQNNMLNQASELMTAHDRPLMAALAESSRVLHTAQGVYGRSSYLAASANADIPSFGERAQASMQSKSALNQEILAVGGMRQGYGMNVGAAAAQAPAVVQASQTLHSMPDQLARPSVKSMGYE